MAPADARAAFFDLDRTLLAGASGPVFSEAMRDAGVLPDQRNPLEPILFRVFDAVGENAPTMWFTRHAVRMTKGWDRGAVRKAAAAAVPTLEERVLPYARQLIERHRQEGRQLVLATTTPEDLVGPLAEALGFDDVVATRYGADGDRYDGSIDGEFVWGKGKARAVREWAEDHDVDLAESYAYSDSYYDVPLLSLVGHPHAVNPDARLRAIATVRRWPQHLVRSSPGRPQVRRSGAAEGGDEAGPPRALPVGPLPRLRREPHPGIGPRDPRREPPLVLRPARHRVPVGAGAAGPSASWGRKRCSTRPWSATSPPRWVASASIAARDPTSPSSQRRTRWPPVTWWRSCRRAPSPGDVSSSTRS